MKRPIRHDEETRYTAEFKACVALDAIREELTFAELSKKHGVHLLPDRANMISGWKRAAIHWLAGHVYMPEKGQAVPGYAVVWLPPDGAAHAATGT